MPHTDDDSMVDRLRCLEEAHAALIDRTAAIEAENRALRARLDASAPTVRASGSSPEATSGDVPVDRRYVLRTGLAVAGAAATAAVLLDGTPAAAAANGDALVLGADGNSSTAPTILTVGGAATDGLVVVDGQPLELPDVPPPATVDLDVPAAVHGQARDRFRAGVFGTSDSGVGVRGHATSGRGVQADTVSGSGVVGHAFVGGTGVIGSSEGGTGVHAASRGARAIHAEASDGATGVVVDGWGTGRGVVISSGGDALDVMSHSGAGAHIRGTTYDLRLTGRAPDSPPHLDSIAHQAGEMVGVGDGGVWLCISAGTPGTWQKMGGPGTAGALHVLSAPVRAYDSRPLGPPAVGPKMPLVPGPPRTIALNASGPIVPAGASAALITVLLVNAASGAGNVTLWAAGVAQPRATTLVWGGDAGRFTTSAVTALDEEGRVQIDASLETHVVLDVVGYYR